MWIKKVKKIFSRLRAKKAWIRIFTIRPPQTSLAICAPGPGHDSKLHLLFVLSKIVNYIQLQLLSVIQTKCNPDGTCWSFFNRYCVSWKSFRNILSCYWVTVRVSGMMDGFSYFDVKSIYNFMGTWSTLSNAFSKATKAIHRSFFFCQILSCASHRL